MKKLLLLFFLCCAPLLRSQEKIPIVIESVEKEIDAFISKEKLTFKLPDEYVKKIKANLLFESKEHAVPFDEKVFQNAILEIKKHELRKMFFEKNPKKKEPYEYPLTNREIQQTCPDGGFENGAPASVYTLRRAINPPMPGGDPTQIQTNNTSFVAQAISGTLNNFNAFGTLVSPGQDPLIPTLNRVLNGNRAFKLNFPENSAVGTSHVVTLSRNLTNINESFLDINYSVILNDPGTSHGLNQKPFFLIRLYDTAGNIIRSVNVLTNQQDCSLSSTNPTTGFNGPFLFTGWNCARINTSDLIGQNVRLEFIIGDCAFGAHFGTVYIDDFCNTNCANPLFGDINLNPIQTITCPTTSQTICGTYQMPANSAYGSISLDIMQGNTVINTIPAPNVLTSNSFCFTVSPADFGTNPNGNYEFRVRGLFIRQCTINYQLDPIFDNSANDTGPDVAFNNCIDAVNDAVSFSTCTMSKIPILENDSVFGNPAATGNVIITQISPVIPQLTLNTSLGFVSVTPGTAPGVYSLTYRICNLNNPSHCDVATVQVTLTPPLLNAVNDDFSASPINGCVGGTTTTVFANDSFCGSFLNPSLFIVSLVNNGGLTGATINSSGNITVPVSVTPGDYTLTYQLCQIANPSNCDTATVLIKVNPGATPIFTFPTAICGGSVPPVLPTISDNGIQGTWSPSVVSNTAPGNYIFTPVGQCAVPVTIPVTLIPGCGIFISWGSDVSCQLTEDDPRIKFDENIADGPCIRVCENSTITYTLTGDIGNIDHTDWNITGGNEDAFTNTSVTITWTSAAFCALQGTIYFTDGTVKEIDKCIEKLEAPNALFGVLPNLESEVIYGCTDNPINFENLTTSGGGNEVIYYNWDFGDGTFSSEFEPSHVYQSTGIYTVTLVAYNGCSCVGKYSVDVKIEEGSVPIACPSVVCEGAVAHYSIPKEYGENCRIEWEAIGGEVVATYTSDTEVDVVWNNIDEDGFGYLTVHSDCFRCPTTIKVPVVQLHGTIKGENTMCVNSQRIFSLPKWPTTEFNWTLEDNGTGAELMYNNQRNEVVVKAGTQGTIKLSCNYTNTLLGCGGTAELKIEVKPSVFLDGPLTVCPNSPETYTVNDENGNVISSIDWVITGPDGFSQNGSDSSFEFSFPAAGLYNFDVTSPEYCTTEVYTIKVIASPQAPTIISGPLTICPGIPVNYTCIPPAGAITHWQVTNGTIIGSATGNQIMVNFNPFPTGAFEVKAWYEYEGCKSADYIINPIIEVPNLALATYDSVVCGSSYKTYSLSNTVVVDNFTWSVEPPSAGSVQLGQNTDEVSVLWNQTPGPANLKLVVRKCGKEFTQLYPVTIINTATITIDGPVAICSGVPASFSFTMNPGTSFTNVTWDFGDGSAPVTSTSTSVSHNFTASANGSASFTVTATVTGANGCPMPAVDTHLIAVSPTPEFSVSPIGNLNLCDPDNTPADYTYSVVLQGGIWSTETVQWYSGTYPTGTAISGATSPTITLSAVGMYYAVVTNGNCSKNTRSIRVYNSCPGSGGCTTPNDLDVAITNIGCQSIRAEVTLAQGSPTELVWSDYSGLGDVVSMNNNHIEIENIEPGEYSITLNAYYDIGGNICHNDEEFTFIVPYKANLKYSITCGSSGMYNVNLYDFSAYYPATPATSFEFSTNNGASWQPGTVINGIAQLMLPLAPGMYNVGIRISRAGYPSCTKFIPLVLPAMPSASFHFDNNACQGAAMQFYAHDTTDGLQYHWNFGGGAINIQQNPIRTFATGGEHEVTLTVKNKYGCTTSFTMVVDVLPVQLKGILASNPVNACQGSTLQIEYAPFNEFQEMPTLFNWYYNVYTSVPFATTTTPNLTVSQSGQYFVYVTDANGCSVYNNPPATAIFVPAPAPPKVTGPGLVCSGNPFSIKVPQNASVQYVWSLNGVPQPQWNNLHTIYDMQTALGAYVYQVVAQVQDGSGNYCSSAPVNHTVTVIDQPAIPELDFEMLSCSPYQYQVTVLNPQAGVSYYWSNGDTGTTAISYHDGPIQVRAEANGCSVTAQTDLPIDLQSVAWVFPKGCYEICKEKPTGYIIGPFGYYHEWQWQDDYTPYASGHDMVEPFDDLAIGHEYQLYLHNGDCEYTAATMSLIQKDCPKCEMSYSIRELRCVKIDGVYVYRVILSVTNAYGDDVWTTFTAPDGEGFFIDNTVLVPGSATTTFTVYFYPTAGFNGGLVTIDMNGIWKGSKSCYTKTEIKFPPCGAPRTANEDLLVVEDNLLLVAPNPAKEVTKAIYNYKNAETAKIIEIRDMQGRFLNAWEVKTQTGTIEIDCTRYAGGQYFILMKENDTVIKQSRLLITH
ncbi:PKD domain-containing protein [Flavobacterium enshiense]|uniref:PKD domain-containing protein n=1 Tax=Flavobacterium enshiense TaxID=1341165 RepID=UPI00345DB0EC